MKKAYHYFITALLALIHPTNKLPSFKYFCKHIQGDSDEEITDAERQLKLYLPKYFK